MRRARTTRVALAIVAAALVALGPTALAGAADSSSSGLFQVRAINALQAKAVTVTYFDTGGGDTPKVTENDKSVSASTPVALPPSTPKAIAVVLDTSSSADKSGALVQAKDALKSWITATTGQAGQGNQFGIYAAGTTGVSVQGITGDTAQLLNALDQVKPNNAGADLDKSALWAATRLAATDLSDNGDLQPNLVIMSARGDNASSDQKDAAVGAVASSQAPVFSEAYTGGGYDTSSLAKLSEQYGGQLSTTKDGTAMGGLFNNVQSTIDTHQYSLSYSSGEKSNKVVSLSMSSGSQTATAVYTSGTATQGYAGLNSAANRPASGGVSLLQGSIGLILAVVLVLVAVSMAAYAIFLLITRENHLTNVLQPYSEGYGPQDDIDEENDGSMAKTAIIQRAVEVTEQFAESQGYLARAESALERANLPLRAGEALFFEAALIVIATVLGLALFGIFGGLILGGFAVITPLAVVSFLAGRRRRHFTSLLPDTLQLLAGTLRAGYSLMQGVEAISQEVEDPMGQELRRVVTESRLGRPLEEALEGIAERMDSPDFGWAVMAIRIQREVGGNLSELLLTVADTMTQRERLRRDVRALTAEGRISALVLGLLPVSLGLLMYVVNPDYMSKLFTDTIGNVLLGLSLVSMVIGFFWMKKIIDIEI